MTEKLVELRTKLKARKPTFIRHDAHKKKRVDGTVWRRPKGRQNKMRLHRKGYAKGRSTGYGSPKTAYGLSPQGLQQVVVRTAEELLALDAKSQGAIISKNVGDKRRGELLTLAQSKKIIVLNLSLDEFNKRIEAAKAEKKEHKKALAKRQEKKDKAAAAAKKKDDKKEDKKEDETASESEEDKKQQEKKEHDKILTQKGDQV